MPGGRTPNSPGFSSTPLKISLENYYASKGLNGDVLSDDEDTFSLLSPIHHDSFDSDEEPSPTRQTSPWTSDNNSRLDTSPVRCELPKVPSEQMLNNARAEPAGSATLSSWEIWLVNKAKEERLRLEKKAEEDERLKETMEQQEREREQKKIVMEKKIQEWLKMKIEQEKHKQFLRQSKEEKEMQWQQDRQRETEQKAQQKYKTWLQKKNQEKVEAEKKEKEEAALKVEQEKERRKRAEKRFKEWLAKANEKSSASPNSSCHPTSPYDRSYPSPSFYNPIPWKPIHSPPENPPNATSNRKPQRQRKRQQSTSAAFRLRNFQNAGQSA